MPWKAKRGCRHPGCRNLVPNGQVYCEEHMQYAEDRMRGTAAERGYDARWRKARDDFLREHPICVQCLKANRKITPATVVDHIEPHRGNRRLFWDRSNWQALCKSCHDEKTASGR